MLCPPSQAVRWLGYRLTPAIQSSIHFRRWLALAQASFTTIQQLSAAGKGLSSWCNRIIVFGAILPILTYGRTCLSWTQQHLRNSTLSGMECSGGQLIVFTPLPVALYNGKPHYHPFPASGHTAVSLLPSSWSVPLRNSILPPPGYPGLCPPGTSDVLWMIIVFFSKALPKPSTLLHDSARRLIAPSTCL